MLEHLWIPVIVIGTSGTAGMIRRLRANLLDELQKQYVVTARAKGMPPFRLLVKYPLRMSLNPFIADIGNLLPSVISGSVIVSVVLSLQTTGPMLLEALRSQDKYLAGSFLMFLALLTVIGMFISDLLLAALDPRIRLTGGAGEMSDAARSTTSRRAPFEPHAAETLTPEQERFYRASQWQIMWWKFRRHRIAVIAGADPARCSTPRSWSASSSRPTTCTRATPTTSTRRRSDVHLFHDGSFVGPFVYGYSMQLNMETLKREYSPTTASGAAAALLLPRRRATSSGA